MDPIHFDRLSKRFASRRQALATGAALAATGMLATNRAATFAQDATPAPFPSDPHPSADTATTHPEFLFTQTFDACTWAPKDGADGTYTLTLTGAAAQTTYFSDRPERVVGLAPTQQFLDGLGFTPDNPPNAALVAQTSSGESDILVLELFNPVYDADAGTLTYDARVLADYGERGLAYLAQQQSDYELAETFGAGSLFIDGCPSVTNDGCYVGYVTPTFAGDVTSGNCWNAAANSCEPCESYSSLCNQTYPDVCQNDCFDDIALCGSPGCYG